MMHFLEVRKIIKQLMIPIFIQIPFRSFYSQFKQDRFIYKNFFKHKKDGFFVEVGAHEGIYLSNTYFFEKKLKWKGICIEPNPKAFKKLKKNRSCLCIEACITPKDQIVNFQRIEGALEMLSGIQDKYDEKHQELIQNIIPLCRDKTETISINGYNLTTLLLQHGIKHVDYLSIDTEGGELDILKSIDFNQIAIDVISVENNYQKSFDIFLNPLGYKKIAQLGVDEIYKKLAIP